MRLFKLAELWSVACFQTTKRNQAGRVAARLLHRWLPATAWGSMLNSLWSTAPWSKQVFSRFTTEAAAARRNKPWGAGPRWDGIRERQSMGVFFRCGVTQVTARQKKKTTSRKLRTHLATLDDKFKCSPPWEAERSAPPFRMSGTHLY